VNNLWIALTVAVFMLLLMPYWLAPIQLRFHRRMVNRPRMVPYDPSHHDLPRAMTAFIEQASGSLVPLGFGIVADLWRADFSDKRGVALVRDEKTGADVWRADFSFMRVVLMRDLKTGEEASVVALRGDDGRDQTLIETHDQVRRRPRTERQQLRVGCVRTRARQDHRGFLGVTDPASLCRISRQLIRRHYGGTDVTPPDDGDDPAAYLTAAMRRELTNQVATGYYRWDEAGQAFRPTWKGALLMTWKLLPPFRQVRESRMRRRSDRLMKEVAGDSNRAVSRHR
jgi:hypothetical protein